MNPNKFSTALNDLIIDNLADVHTIIPAKISSVDYGSGRASVQPLIQNYVGVNKIQNYPPLSDVPLMILSGNAGKSSITFPVSAGDTVLVLCSERDPTNILSGTGDTPQAPIVTSPLGLYPVGIIPCIYTSGSAKAIDKTKVVLSNEKGTISLSPDGTMELKNNGGRLVFNSDGSFNINGLIITPDGLIKDSAGIQLNTHKHSGVNPGGSETQGPVA
jgi:hypothetical protein